MYVYNVFFYFSSFIHPHHHHLLSLLYLYYLLWCINVLIIFIIWGYSRYFCALPRVLLISICTVYTILAVGCFSTIFEGICPRFGNFSRRIRRTFAKTIRCRIVTFFCKYFASPCDLILIITSWSWIYSMCSSCVAREVIKPHTDFWFTYLPRFMSIRSWVMLACMWLLSISRQPTQGGGWSCIWSCRILSVCNQFL